MNRATFKAGRETEDRVQRLKNLVRDKALDRRILFASQSDALLDLIKGDEFATSLSIKTKHESTGQRSSSSTIAESGRRAVISNVRVDQGFDEDGVRAHRRRLCTARSRKLAGRRLDQPSRRSRRPTIPDELCFRNSARPCTSPCRRHLLTCSQPACILFDKKTPQKQKI